MRNRHRTFQLTLVLCLAFAPGALAQRVTERSLLSGSVGSGARALGMGGAFIAIADDATASSWNPAGLCVLEKPEASVAYQPSAKYTTQYAAASYEQRSPLSSPTTVYTYRYDPETYQATSRAFDFASVTFPFRIGRLKLVPQVNYQRVIDFGLDADYGAPWTRNYVYRSGTTISTISSRYADQGRGDTSGGIDLVAASLGLSFTPKLYLGVAVNRWRNGSEGTGDYSWTAAHTDSAGAYNESYVSKRHLVDEYSGTSLNLGLLLKPSEKVRFGVVYKSAFSMTYDYTYKAESTTTSDRTGVRSTVQDTILTGTIQWPWSLGAGIAFLPTDALTVSVDLTRSNWSSADAHYTQTITTWYSYLNPPTRTSVSDIDTTWPAGFNKSQPESAYNPRQTDSTQVRLGTEYVITRPGLLGLTALPLRVGFLDDQQLFKNRPDLGGVHYLGLTGGLGLVWARLSVDFAYVHTRGEYKCCEYDVQDPGSSRKQTEDAQDSFRSHRFFLSSTVRF